MKASLQAQQKALEELWEQGLSGQPLLEKHSGLIDDFINNCFGEVGNDKASSSVALIALGGYGRQELFPYSDIDLMILYSPWFKRKIQEVGDAVLYPLWDTGMEVGHGVRTIKESIRQGKEDFFFQVAMIDARLIAGSQKLFDKLQVQYKKKFIEGQRHEFVRTMKLFRSERRKRFGAHAYLLEPHIKEGKGGLRDVQAMLWTAKVVFGLDGLSEIVSGGILLEDEAQEFSSSWNMLVKIRNRLHYISRRKNDQLYFEQQVEMAEAFGYAGKDGVLGVEQFMREVYSHLQTVAVSTDLFFGHVDEVLGLKGEEERFVDDRVVERGVEIRNNRICLTESAEAVRRKPQLLMRVFLASARSGLPVHHRTQRAVSLHLDLISGKAKRSGRLSRPFFEILMEGKDVLSVLEAMLETGMLGAYIPEFKRIHTLAQHDLYHIFTVDRHTLQAISELRKVLLEEPQIAREVVSQRVLYLAVLLHDIGKGAGGDHSIIGAELAPDVGERLGLTEEECGALAFVVRYHLFLPEKAMRRDLSDEAFIGQCSETIRTHDRLAMLYLLSVADSKATGPSAWSDWKAALLKEMFLKIHARFGVGRGDKSADSQGREYEAQGAAWLRGQVEALLVGEQFFVEINDLADDYLTSFTPEVIAGHVMLHAENRNLLRQKSLVLGKKHGDRYSLLIMAHDRAGLLAKICGVLALRNLNVLNAQIFTWKDGTVVDVVSVRGVEGKEYDKEDWQELNRELDLAINHRLDLANRLYEKLRRLRERQKAPAARYESRVVIDNTSSGRFTVIEVYSVDQPGQLYAVTQALADFGIAIFKAFVATEVEQLIDVFYVLDGSGKKIQDQPAKERVRDGLLGVIGNPRWLNEKK